MLQSHYDLIMWWQETNLTDAMDFLRFGNVKFNTVKKRHRVLNIVWYIIAAAIIAGWGYLIYGRL